MKYIIFVFASLACLNTSARAGYLGLDLIDKKQPLSSKALSVKGIEVYTREIEVYYETLCPDSKAFVSNQLQGIADHFYGKFRVDVKLIPYGKANHYWNGNKWIFSCQHGDDECFGNLIHNCMINQYPSFIQHFPFIKCTMSREGSSFQQIANECCMMHNIPLQPLLDCAKNDLGNNLLYQAGKKTKETLYPPLNYVPWLIVNREHNDYIQRVGQYNLILLLCQQRSDSNKPSVCGQIRRVLDKALEKFLKEK